MPYLLAIVLSIFTLTGCQSAYYSAMEQVGYHKRDIMVDRVEDAKESQQEAPCTPVRNCAAQANKNCVKPKPLTKPCSAQ